MQTSVASKGAASRAVKDLLVGLGRKNDAGDVGGAAGRLVDLVADRLADPAVVMAVVLVGAMAGTQAAIEF